MKLSIFCSQSRRSEVAVELLQLVEGEAEMSRNVERNLGRGLITLMTVATLFVAVAIPSTSFAKPEGDPDKKSEIVLWHKVWDKDKQVDKFLTKFSDEDLKSKKEGDDDKKKPSEKVQSWMKLMEKKDEAKQSEFISKFVSEPGVEKKEVIEPFKMVQALRSIMIETRANVWADKKHKTDEARKEAFTSLSDKMAKWLDVSEVPGLEKAYGSKAKAMSDLVKRVVKVLQGLSKEELESMSEEDLIKKIFNEELKKALGIDPSNKNPKEEKPEGDKEKEDAEKKALNEKLKKLEEELAAAKLKADSQLPATPVPGTGEVDLSGIEQAVAAACAEDDNDDQLGDLAKALEDKINDLERQLADNVNDDQDNNDQALLDSLIAGLAGQQENDENNQAEQAQAPTPPQSPIPSQQPQTADSGEELPETPQPLGPQPIPPQQASTFSDGEPVKAITAGLRGPTVDFRDGIIAASRGVLATMKDELGMGGLLNGMSTALTATMHPLERMRLAGIKKMQAYQQYSEAKTRRDQHEAAADAIRSELRTLEAGMDPLFAKFNPAAALAIQKGEAKIKELEDQKKQLSQQASQTNADGSPRFDSNSVQTQTASIQQAIRRQEEEIQNAQLAKANFIATQDTSFKDLKSAMEEHTKYGSEFGTQVKKFANEYQTALGEETSAQTLLGQQQSGAIPTVNGSVAAPFTNSQGYNRFNGSGLTTGRTSSVLPTMSNSNSTAVRGSLAGGPQR